MSSGHYQHGIQHAFRQIILDYYMYNTPLQLSRMGYLPHHTRPELVSVQKLKLMTLRFWLTITKKHKTGMSTTSPPLPCLL